MKTLHLPLLFALCTLLGTVTLSAQREAATSNWKFHATAGLGLDIYRLGEPYFPFLNSNGDFRFRPAWLLGINAQKPLTSRLSAGIGLWLRQRGGAVRDWRRYSGLLAQAEQIEFVETGTITIRYHQIEAPLRVDYTLTDRLYVFAGLHAAYAVANESRQTIRREIFWGPRISIDNNGGASTEYTILDPPIVTNRQEKLSLPEASKFQLSASFGAGYKSPFGWRRLSADLWGWYSAGQYRIYEEVFSRWQVGGGVRYYLVDY